MSLSTSPLKRFINREMILLSLRTSFQNINWFPDVRRCNSVVSTGHRIVGCFPKLLDCLETNNKVRYHSFLSTNVGWVSGSTKTRAREDYSRAGKPSVSARCEGVAPLPRHDVGGGRLYPFGLRRIIRSNRPVHRTKVEEVAIVLGGVPEMPIHPVDGKVGSSPRGRLLLLGSVERCALGPQAAKRLMKVPVYFELVVTRYSATAVNYLCR